MTSYVGDELEILSDTGRYHRWIVEQFSPYLDGKIIEIGAGLGTLSRYWQPYVEEMHLVEPAENLFSALQKTYGQQRNVALHRGNLQQAIAQQPALSYQAFDAAIMINVLEHIEDDAGTLTTLHRMLRSRGYLLVFVPAMQALYGSLDIKFSHYRRYERSDLALLAKTAGFEIIHLYYFDAAGVAPWWFVNRVLKASRLSPSMARVYDRFVVPFARIMEQKWHPPFGKNLVLIARKP